MKDMLLLVEPLIPALRRYARSIIRDRALADDLVQDCLERAIARWHQRRTDGDVRAWLFTILHNLAISQMRQTKRRGYHDGIDDADEQVTATRATQEDSLAYGDLMRAVQLLPEDQRSAWRAVFDHYVFGANGDPAGHIPEGAKGALGALTPERLTRMRATLRQIARGV